jgi:hypothetical protein
MMMKVFVWSFVSVTASSVAAATTSSSSSSKSRFSAPTIDRELQQVQADCSGDEDVATLDLLLDDHPEDTGLTMICDDEVIWEVEQGSLTSQEASSWVSHQYCAPKSVEKCVLTITDASGNGLEGDGWYSFVSGATTVAVYDGLPFFENVHCFGTACKEVAQEVADLETECNPIVFDIQLDSKPAETSFTLTCGDEVVWDVAGQNKPFHNIKLEECIPHDACCSLTIRDQGNDGLTLGNKTHSGYFALEADYQDKIRYYGADGMQFGSLSVAFGSDKCMAKQIDSASSTDADKSFTVGAVVGAFFGGVVGVLLIGLVARLFLNAEEDVPAIVARQDSGSPDDESKASTREQVTVHSDDEHSA